MDMKKLAVVTKVILVSQYSHEEIQSFLDGCVIKGAKPMQGVAKLAADDYTEEVSNTSNYLYVGVLRTPDPDLNNRTAFSNDLRDFISQYQEAAMLGLMTAEISRNLDDMLRETGSTEFIETLCCPDTNIVH